MRFDVAVIRVVLPFHLRTLARANDEVQLEIESPVTLRSVLDALEARYPVLRGTLRDHATLQRRPFIRFFACKEDLSLSRLNQIARCGHRWRGATPNRGSDGGRLNGKSI